MGVLKGHTLIDVLAGLMLLTISIGFGIRYLGFLSVDAGPFTRFEFKEFTDSIQSQYDQENTHPQAYEWKGHQVKSAWNPCPNEMDCRVLIFEAYGQDGKRKFQVKYLVNNE